MPEIKEFTQGQFADTFGKSASDLISSLQAAPAQPVTSAATTVVDDDKNKVPGETAQDTLDRIAKEAKDGIAQTETSEAKAIREAKELEAKNSGTPPADPKKGKGRPAVEKLDDSTKSLFKTLIDDEKIFGFEDGKIETPKDILDLIEANADIRYKEREKTIMDDIVKSMTPAMQTVLKYSQSVQSAQELLPLLGNMSNIEKFSTLDETNVQHQELIIRERMRLNGDTQEVIDQEIQDIKDRDKLGDFAKRYKPIVAGFYEKEANRILQEKQQEDQQYVAIIQENDLRIRKVLDSPTELEGIKLKNNHKGLIYEMLAVPREEYGGGVGIYSVIDKLFMDKNFNALSLIALLATDKKAFDEVYSTKVKIAEADHVQRVLRTNTKSGSPIVDDQDDNDLSAQRQLKPKRSGFGF